MENLALTDRAQLPDALRVLLADYPRAGWEDDPGFDGLIRFWLDRHLMFRRIMGEMRSGTEAMLDRKMAPDRYASMVSRYGGMFVNGLHEHHTIEDTYYFPKLATKDPRITRGFEILDKDHHAIDGFLAGFVDRANEVINTSADRDALQTVAGAFQEELTQLERLLNRHLVDEEDLIVPVILRYGSSDLG
jgi:hemerythrin-like domain-containing protein